MSSSHSPISSFHISRTERTAGIPCSTGSPRRCSPRNGDWRFSAAAPGAAPRLLAFNGSVEVPAPEALRTWRRWAEHWGFGVRKKKKKKKKKKKCQGRRVTSVGCAGDQLFQQVKDFISVQQYSMRSRTSEIARFDRQGFIWTSRVAVLGLNTVMSGQVSVSHFLTSRSCDQVGGLDTL